jgi:hypothetical protein
VIKKHPPDHLSERLRPHEIPHPTLSRDTDPKAEAVQIEIYRRMPAWRKVELVADAIETSRLLALAGLRGRFPEAGEEEIRRRFMDLTLGEELAAKAYGPPPYAGKSRTAS